MFEDRTETAEMQAGEIVAAPVQPRSQPFDGAAYLARMKEAPPAHVAILGLGPSSWQYFHLTRCLGGRKRLADEVWAINAFGDIAQCDLVFHMDDVRIQQIRVDAKPESNIAVMLSWLREHPGPVMTCRTHPDFRGLVEFPLEEIVNSTGWAYFNNTVPYAVAFAIHIGVKKISLFGCDYTYKNSHDAEKGRGCLEFWLALAGKAGIEIHVPDSSTLLDSNEKEGRLYGFSDTREVTMALVDGMARFTFVDRTVLPTAAEIEARYDHSPKSPDPAKQ